MALSDCEKCWDTPCSCGWDYRNYTKERFINFIVSIFKYRTDKEEVIKEIVLKLKEK